MAKTALPGSGGTGDVAGGVLHASDIDRLPGGWLDYTEVTSNVNAVNSVASLAGSGMTLTVTVNGSRKIRITAFAHFGTASTNDDFKLAILEGGTQLNQNTIRAALTSSTANYGVTVQAVVSGGTAGSHTFICNGGMLAGTGPGTLVASSTNPAWFLVEDIGPS